MGEEGVMATLLDVNGRREIEVPNVSVGQTRQAGALPQHYVVIDKDHQGVSRQVSDHEVLQDRVYPIIPLNRPGAERICCYE